MKLNNIVYAFNDFAAEMAKLRNEKHFDYLVTIIGEDFGEEGLGCIYILENTDTHERISVKTMAEKKGEHDVIFSVTKLWKCADLLEREVFDFYGIKFLGHPDMRRLYLRSDFKGHPFRKDFVAEEGYTLEDDKEQDYTTQYNLDSEGNIVVTTSPLFTDDDFIVNIGPQHPSTHGVLRLQTILDGETVKKIYPHLGYIHRGIEKMFEEMTKGDVHNLLDTDMIKSFTEENTSGKRELQLPALIGIDKNMKVIYSHYCTTIGDFPDS